MSMIHGDPIHWCLLVSMALYVPKLNMSLQNAEEIIILKLERKLTRVINAQMLVIQATRSAVNSAR